MPETSPVAELPLWGGKQRGRAEFIPLLRKGQKRLEENRGLSVCCTSLGMARRRGERNVAMTLSNNQVGGRGSPVGPTGRKSRGGRFRPFTVESFHGILLNTIQTSINQNPLASLIRIKNESIASKGM